MYVKFVWKNNQVSDMELGIGVNPGGSGVVIPQILGGEVAGDRGRGRKI